MFDEDKKTVLITRLKEIFKDTTQSDTAGKLNTVQSNISKWEHGKNLPTVDRIYDIAEAYNVSADWLLGLSDIKEVNGIKPENLTYKQVATIIDYLIQNGTIEIPNLAEVPELQEIIQQKSDEDELNEENKPITNSDYVKIKDLFLSSIMRKRLKVMEAGYEFLEDWRNKLEPYKELNLLSYSDDMHKLLIQEGAPKFNGGDWIEIISELLKYNASQIREIIKRKGGIYND